MVEASWHYVIHTGSTDFLHGHTPSYILWLGNNSNDDKMNVYNTANEYCSQTVQYYLFQQCYGGGREL